MNTQISTTAALSFDELQLYKQHLRIINKILCSYSRYEAFVAAVAEIDAADKYSVVADMHVGHDDVYHFDEEGIMNSYKLSDED